jgi:hypothetical protein
MVLNLISTRVALSDQRVPIALTLIGSANRVPSDDRTPLLDSVILRFVFCIIFVHKCSFHLQELLSFLSDQSQISVLKSRSLSYLPAAKSLVVSIFSQIQSTTLPFLLKPTPHTLNFPVFLDTNSAPGQHVPIRPIGLTASAPA